MTANYTWQATTVRPKCLGDWAYDLPYEDGMQMRNHSVETTWMGSKHFGI
jgi:hypothetical protein